MERPRIFTVSAWSAVSAPLSEVGAWRDDPGALPSGEMPRRFLRHADEQTVAACRAVLCAIADDRRSTVLERPTADDGDPHRSPLLNDQWGVLAASCGAGRIMGAATLAATRTAGSAGVSTHVVPQCSLHAAASSISVLLGLHGPHFGIGGGPEAFGEALMVADAMLAFVPPKAGLWLVLTGWQQEPLLDDAGIPMKETGDPILHAFAMALLRETGIGGIEVELARAEDGVDARSPAMLPADPVNRSAGTRVSLGEVVAAVAAAGEGRSITLGIGPRIDAIFSRAGMRASDGGVTR